MYEMTVVWPDGRRYTSDGYSFEEANAINNFLRAAGASDVMMRCCCDECKGER